MNAYLSKCDEKIMLKCLIQQGVDEENMSCYHGN